MARDFTILDFTISRRRVKNVRQPRLLILLLFAAFLPQQSTAQEKPTRHVLIVNEVGTSYPFINMVDEGIRSALGDVPYRIDFNREYMDTMEFPAVEEQERIRDFYVQKYRTHRPDVIITVGSSPLKFIAAAHDEFFAGVPVVFCLPNRTSGQQLGSQFTGVDSDFAPAATISAALRLAPETRGLVVIGGVGPFDRQLEDLVKQQLKPYENHLEIAYLTDFRLSALLDRVKHLPRQTIILLLPVSRDASGVTYSANQISPLVVAAASAPVFSVADTFMNHGEIGGDLSSGFDEGKSAGGIALRLLNGESPKNIRVVTTGDKYEFDWRALKRWGMKESALPPGSIVLNRPPSFWEAYKTYILIGIFVFLAQSVAICALAIQRLKTKRAKAELAESEKRFRLVANSAPVMIWMSGPDKLCNYFNQQWLDFTGRPMEAELGDGWSEGVHPADIKKCLDTYVAAFDRRERFTMEYRLQRSAGDYRWVLDIGVPRFNADGSFAGYIGSCLDVTERKQAEEALANIGGRLIAAQEQERTRIARELHDDINQQLAFLSVMLDQFRQNPPRSISQIRRRVEGFVKQVADASESVQALSHRLHSSKLEYLGLMVAIQSFCREFAAQHHVEVNFSHESVPENVPQEIALCLFRVAQAALVNALKHSGVKSFDVILHGTKEGVGLVVHDSGVGFDTEQMLKHDGIGLISIRERTRFVNGRLAIHSKPNGGTTIDVEVPLPSEQSQSFPSMAESQAGNRAFHQVQ